RATRPLRLQATRFPFERALFMGVAAVIGLYGGIAAGLFATAIRFVQLLIFRGPEVASSLFGHGHQRWLRSFRGRLGAAHWRRVLGPALGALLAALVVRVSPESGGHGVVEVIEAVHKRTQIKGRVAVWKSLAAGLVIGSGGSAGREGPVVHLGGAVASSLS